VTSNEPWQRLVTIGPAAFAAYARVRFIPDPTHQGQQEHEADLDGSPGDTDQWRALLHLLAADTADPDDCYFGLWEGWGFPESARGWPTLAVPRDAQLPARSYFLFGCGSVGGTSCCGGLGGNDCAGVADLVYSFALLCAVKTPVAIEVAVGLERA